jgi:peptidyl-prolyl cis-trans isomerase SurA
MIKIRFVSFLLTACSLGLLSFSLAAAPAQKKLPVLDRMVASVNNEAITESELNRQTELLLIRLRQTDTPMPSLKVLHKQLLEKMILEKCQLQIASAEGMAIDEKTLNQAIHEIASRDNLSIAEMQQFLEEQGISFAQFRETIKTELLLSKIQQKEVGQRITISKAEVEHFLASPAGQDQSGTEYHLSHILIPLPEEHSKTEFQKIEANANTIAKELKKGGDFAKVAMAKSAGQQALEGGDLGWRNTAAIPSTFAKIAPTLRVGEVYGPIRNDSGYHIIKLLAKRSPNVQQEQSPTQARNKAMDMLYQRKFDELVVNWLRHLRSEAEIKIYLNEA